MVRIMLVVRKVALNDQKKNYPYGYAENKAEGSVEKSHSLKTDAWISDGTLRVILAQITHS